MTKIYSKLMTSVCLAALLAVMPRAAWGTDKEATAGGSATPSSMDLTGTSGAGPGTPAPSAASSTKAARPIPFRGTISAVDAGGKTFTVAGKTRSRVFKITEKSVLTKGGAPATLSDVTAKEEVRGSYWKQADGSLEAKSVKLGPLTEQEKAAIAAKKAKHAARMKEKGAATPAPTATP